MMNKDFMLDEIFNIYSPPKRFNANTVKFGGKYPYVARGSSNNGIRGYITEDVKYLSPAHSLSFGQDTATVFYQPRAYFTGDKIKIMVLRDRELDEKLAQYFICIIAKAFSLFNWGQNSFNENIIKSTNISLPVIENANPDHEYTVDDIDWQYMRDRITELERDCITELDAYLRATGLDDCKLTVEDKTILSLSAERISGEDGSLEDNSEDAIRFGKFKLGTLFESQTGDVDLQQKDINNKGYFFINSGVENRGIKGKTDRPAKVFKAGTITIDFWGNAYYRDFDYVMATHNHVFSLSGDVIKNEKVGHYIIGKLSKLPQLFSYNNMATWNKLKVLDISLPINADAPDDYTVTDINFDYMERYIRAMEKVVIADVVKYKDKVIETTKRVVGK